MDVTHAYSCFRFAAVTHTSPTSLVAINTTQGPCKLNQDFIVNETSTITYVKRVINVVHSKGLRYKSRSDGTKELQGEGRVHIILFELLAQSCKLLQAITEGRGGDESIQKALAEQLNIKLFQSHVRRIWGAHNDLYDRKRKDRGKLSPEDKKEIEKNLMDAGYDLFSVYMQLAANDSAIMSELIPRGKPAKGGHSLRHSDHQQWNRG